jgi:hypothetical protein
MTALPFVSPPTHADLVAAAARWLVRARHCTVVITEMASGAGEEPDAIGWSGAWSTVVECKVSAADLRADKLKPCRRRGEGFGNSRWYLFPDRDMAQLVSEVDPGWGVLYLSPRGKVVKVRDAEHRGECDAANERGLLVSALRRLGVKSEGGVSVRVYIEQTKCRATLTVKGLPVAELLPP